MCVFEKLSNRIGYVVSYVPSWTEIHEEWILPIYSSIANRCKSWLNNWKLEYRRYYSKTKLYLPLHHRGLSEARQFRIVEIFNRLNVIERVEQFYRRSSSIQANRKISSRFPAVNPIYDASREARGEYLVHEGGVEIFVERPVSFFRLH